MKYSLALAALLGVSLGAPTHAQSPQGMRGVAVAVIDAIYADSAGHAFRGSRPIALAALDSTLSALRPRFGATIWFSWAGGATHQRTAAQDSLLTRVRQSGIRVELRTDSTSYARVIR